MATITIHCRNTLDPLMESYGFTRYLPKLGHTTAVSMMYCKFSPF